MQSGFVSSSSESGEPLLCAQMPSVAMITIAASKIRIKARTAEIVFFNVITSCCWNVCRGVFRTKDAAEFSSCEEALRDVLEKRGSTFKSYKCKFYDNRSITYVR